MRFHIARRVAFCYSIGITWTAPRCTAWILLKLVGRGLIGVNVEWTDRNYLVLAVFLDTAECTFWR